MSNTKVNLKIQLPGNSLYSEQECSENSETCCDYNSMFVHYKNEKASRKARKPIFESERIQFLTRRPKPIFQHVPISEEAYNYFISESCPDNFPQGMSLLDGMKAWKKLPKDLRLKWHLNAIAHDKGGKVVSFEVLND